MRIAGLACAALLLFAAPADADRLDVRGDRLFLAVKVNGHPVEALLDSAAELSVADADFARELHLADGQAVTAQGSGGQQDAQIVPGVLIQAAGVALRDTPIGVTDLGEVGQRLTGRTLNFILGRDFFSAARLKIDIRGGTIEPLDPGDTATGIELALTEHHGISAIPALVGNKPVQADFDLGNGTGLLVSAALARDLGLRVIGVEPAGGLGGAKPREVVYLPELTIAGRRFTHLRAHIDPTASAGAINVGVALMRNFTITTDFEQHKIWLDPL